MSTPNMVPMLAPDGTAGYVPSERVNDALKMGGKLGVEMSAPDGTRGIVPRENIVQAIQMGGNVLHDSAQYTTQFEQERNKQNQPGILSSAFGELGNMVKGIPEMNISPRPENVAMATVPLVLQDEQRKQQGRSAAYRWVAGLGQLAGVNSSGMERAADVGNARGVAGIATGDAIPVVASPFIGKAVDAAIPAAKRALLMGKTPQGAYESALKPSTTYTEAERAALVNTALQERIPVSKGGLQKLGDLVDDLNNRIADTIKASPNTPISAEKVATRAQQAAEKLKVQVNPESDMAAVEAAREEWLRTQGAKPAIPPKPTGLVDQYGANIMDSGSPATKARDIPAAEAQAIKQGTYRVLGDKAYGEIKSASVEAQKALARGLKEEIANAFPELSKLNAREGRLLDLQDPLEKAVARIGNHQFAGIGTPIVTGATKVVTGSNKLAVAAGVMKAVLDNPVVKSRLAIAISKGGALTPVQAMSRISSFQSRLGSAAALLQSSASADSSANQASQPDAQ